MDRRSQKKQAKLKKLQLAKEFTDNWEENYGKEPRAAPLEEQQTPPNTDKNTGKEAVESGSQVSQEVTSTSAPNIPAVKYTSDLPAEENPPHTGKETESGSQCSQKLTTSSVPEVTESLALPEQPTPPIINYNTGRGSQELTSFSEPYIPVEKYASDLPAEKNPPQPNVNKITVKETVSGSKCSQELTTSSVPKVPVKHSATADILLPAEEDTETMESNTTERERIESGSSHAQNPFNTIAAAAVSGMKAPAIIVSRAKVTEEPWTVTGWVPEMDNIHPSAEELEAGVTFERLYDIIHHRDGSPPPSPNDDTGTETESSSHGSQELTISSVLNRTSAEIKYDRFSTATIEK